MPFRAEKVRTVHRRVDEEGPESVDPEPSLTKNIRMCYDTVVFCGISAFDFGSCQKILAIKRDYQKGETGVSNKEG